MMIAQLDDLAAECLRNCTECHNICVQTSVSSDVVGKISLDDLKLLTNCAAMCRTCADVIDTMAGHHAMAAYHVSIHRACADVCAACGAMCRQSGIPVMLQCADVCDRCADSCRRMAAQHVHV